METDEKTQIVRAIRRLTIAVWALTVVMVAFLAMYLIAYIPALSPSFTSVEAPPSQAPAIPSRFDTQVTNFHDWPLEKQITTASVIALARYEKDGDRTKCVISEILKQAPGTKFYYNVGDEYRQCSHYPKPNEDRGDGQVMFFLGNPAEFRFSTSFRGDRLTGLGDIPFDLFRKQIGQAK